MAKVLPAETLDLAGRIIADVDGGAISRTEALLLATAVEQLWEIVVEAGIFAVALSASPRPDPKAERIRQTIITHQRDLFVGLMATVENPRKQS